MLLQRLPLRGLGKRYIDSGGFQSLMAERLLQGLDVSSSGNVMRRHRVPERMRRGVGDPHFLQVLGDGILNRAFTHRRSELGDKERTALH